LVTALLLTFIFVVPDLEGFLPVSVRGHKTLLLIFEMLGFVAVTGLLLRAVKGWVIVGKTLSILVGVMLVLTLYRIGSYGVSDGGFIIEPVPQRKTVSVEGFRRPDGVPPNIYYLLVDGYTRADTLLDYYGYDNSEFIDFLEEKGFQVAHNSFANYHNTRVAVPTVLNFEYMASQSGFKENVTEDYRVFLNDKTFNNRTASILRELGYRVVTIRSTGHYVRTADSEELLPESNWFMPNEFESAVLDTTLLPRIFNKRNFRKLIRKIYYGGKASFEDMSRDLVNYDRERVDFVIEEISRQASREGPVFLIAHIMVPHHPFIYDVDGNVPDISPWMFGEREYFAVNARAYVDQVDYLNKLLRDMVNNILSQSVTPPIIILQGDHGLRLTLLENRGLDEKIQAELACPRELFSNLNALYLPASESKTGFYKSISPVNTFRLIFDTYFGGELGMLADRSFFSTKNGDDETMSFIEMTGSQESCHQAWEERFRELP